MWCTFDAEDVVDEAAEDEARNLGVDPLWGWVHKRGEAWHTITGMPLSGKRTPESPLVAYTDDPSGSKPNVVLLRMR